MELIYKTNFGGAKRLLREYLQNSDFSKPFILAGWTGIGKSALVNQVHDETGIDFIIDRCGELEDKELLALAEQKNDKSRVIEVTINDESDLRFLLMHGYPVIIQEMDINEWLQWARNKNDNGIQNIKEDFCKLIEANHENAHSNIKINKERVTMLDQLIQKVEDYNGRVWDELFNLVDEAYKGIQTLYVTRADSERFLSKLLEGLKKQMAETNPQFSGRIVRLVRNLSELNSQVMF